MVQRAPMVKVPYSPLCMIAKLCWTLLDWYCCSVFVRLFMYGIHRDQIHLGIVTYLDLVNRFLK